VAAATAATTVRTAAKNLMSSILLVEVLCSGERRALQAARTVTRRTFVWTTAPL
jgi:hypothetical protein